MLTCIDGRIHRALDDWARDRLAVDYVDTITEPGPDSQVVAMDDAALTGLVAKVRVSQRAHGSDVLVIAAHSDCAGNPVSDHAHRAHLHRAAARLATRLPGTRIVAVHAGRCGPDCWRPQFIAEVIPVPPPGGSRKEEPTHARG
jgi:hypothetical protein